MGHVEQLHKYFNKNKAITWYELRRGMDRIKHQTRRDWEIFKRESRILHGVILDDDTDDRLLINALKRGGYND